jgi:hypothetical protein
MKLARNYLYVVIFIPLLLIAQHWSSDHTISASGYPFTGENNGRKIAISHEGVIHSVWTDFRDESSVIMYSRSTDYGETWPLHIEISQCTLYSHYPAIAVSGDTIHVAWIVEEQQGQGIGSLYYRRSCDEGNTWDDWRCLDEGEWNRFPTITAAQSEIIVVWEEYLLHLKAMHSRNRGTDWDPALTIYTYTQEYELFGEASIAFSVGEGQPVIHVIAGRNVFQAADTQWSDVIYIRSNNGGSTWESYQVLPSTHIDDRNLDFSTIAARNNMIHVAWTVHSARMSSKGDFESAIKDICSIDNGRSWSEVNTVVSSDVANLNEVKLAIDAADLVHLVWAEYGNHNTVKYKRYIDENWQSTYTLSAVTSSNVFPCIATNDNITEWTKENGLYVVWTDWCALKFKRGWQIGENASYPNQGRHLARTVNTRNCYQVFQGENALFWQSRSGQTVNPPVGISDGKYPSVAVSPGGLSWICYTTETENGQQLKCQIRNEFSTEEILLFDAESIFAPSLILATKIGDMGYVVSTIKNQGEYEIYFTAFDRDGVYYQTSLDRGNNDRPVSRPSISITPADYLHIVWQKLENNASKIYYVTHPDAVSPDMIRHGYQPHWFTPERISRPGNPCTEPASNPFVEAYGGVVYVDWRGPYDEHNETGEIWQRWGKIRPGQLPVWNKPWNVSESRDKESDYPVQSTSAFVAWQELEPEPPDNWEIKLRYNTDDVCNVSNTETPSQYPHINVMYSDEQAPHEYFIWTETNAPDIYELRFCDYQYTSGKDNLDEIVYYTVNAGDSTPSFYCQHRDGYIHYPNYSIDFGQPLLQYRLDYLNPAYYYKGKAIVYHNTAGRFKQTFSFDNILVDSIEFPQAIPETVEIYIPKSTYRQDLQSVLRANRSRGNFSALASFDLQQFEIIDSAGTGTGQQSIGYTTVTLTPINNFPNPFKTHTSVRYSLSIASRVSLAVYNASGRLIRTLINQPQASGIYSVNWDGTDNQKKLVPAGVYFYRLNTDYSSQTNKVSIIR